MGGTWFNHLLLQWIQALAATTVAWPKRAVTGRWPVVAYVLDPHDSGIPARIVWVDGRAKADEIAAQWVRHVKDHGAPPKVLLAEQG